MTQVTTEATEMQADWNASTQTPQNKREHLEKLLASRLASRTRLQKAYSALSFIAPDDMHLPAMKSVLDGLTDEVVDIAEQLVGVTHA